jgi:hypothetical protein
MEAPEESPRKLQRRRRFVQAVGHVLGVEDALGEAALEGGAQALLAVALEHRVQALDAADPDAGPTVSQSCDVVERWAADLKEVLALDVALGATPGDGGDLPARCCGSVERAPGSVRRRWTAANRLALIRTRSRYRCSVPAMPIASGGMEYGCVSCSTMPFGPTITRMRDAEVGGERS